MMRAKLFMALTAILTIAGCLPTSDDHEGFPVLSVDEYRNKSKQFRAESERMTREYVAAKIELIERKLKDARQSGDADEETRILVEEGLRSAYKEIRLHFLKLAGGMDSKTIKTLREEIVSLRHDPYDIVRAEVLAILAKIADDNAYAIVMEASQDISPLVRASAGTSLRQWRSPQTVARLKEMLLDGEPDAQTSALITLGMFKEQSAVNDIVQLITTRNCSPEIIARGIDTLGNIGSVDALDTIVTFLKYPADGVRWSAINSVGKIGNGLYAHYLRPFLRAPQPTHIRLVAIQSLAKLRDEESFAEMKRILAEEDDPHLKGEAAKYIARCGDSSLATDTLLPLFLAETDAALKKTIWEAILQTSSEKIDALCAIAVVLANDRLLPELEEIALNACRLNKKEFIARTSDALLPALLALVKDEEAVRINGKEALAVLNALLDTQYTEEALHNPEKLPKMIDDWEKCGQQLPKEKKR